MRGKNLGPHRVVEAGFREVGGVEGFIHHGAIGAGTEAVHHGGREVAGAGPHGDAHERVPFVSEMRHRADAMQDMHISGIGKCIRIGYTWAVN